MLLTAWALVETRRGVSRSRAVNYARRALASGAFEEAGERLNAVTALVSLTCAGEVDEAALAYAALISSTSGKATS